MKGHSASTWVYLKSEKNTESCIYSTGISESDPTEAKQKLLLSPSRRNTYPCFCFTCLKYCGMLSKVYKRLVLSQMIEHIDRHGVLNEKISGYKKGHSTTTVLLHFRGDIGCVEALVLLKLDFNDIVLYPLQQYLEAKSSEFKDTSQVLLSTVMQK